MVKQTAGRDQLGNFAEEFAKLNDDVLFAVNNLAQYGVTQVSMLAMVTDTSYEVVFYGLYAGKMYQSNEMVENGFVASSVVDIFYKNIAHILRMSDKFQQGKMNIVSIGAKNTISIKYDEKNCRLYPIQKAWRDSIGLGK